MSPVLRLWYGLVAFLALVIRFVALSALPFFIAPPRVMAATVGKHRMLVLRIAMRLLLAVWLPVALIGLYDFPFRPLYRTQ